MPRKARCTRGGNSLTALQLDPYYLKKLYGKGLFDWFKPKKSKTEEKENAEIMEDIARAKLEIAKAKANKEKHAEEKTTHTTIEKPRRPKPSAAPSSH